MANQSLDLDAYLAQQSDAGRVDSQGDFTVSHNEAVRKLARFALPRSTAWVSKLVQAAVRWRCTALYVNQSRSETKFHFVMGEPELVPTEQEILGALVSAGITGPKALDAFGLALRGLVEQSHLSFLLACPSSEGGEPKRIYAGAHYGRLSEQERLALSFVKPGGLSLTVYHLSQPGLRGGWERVADRRGARAIIEEIQGYAYMCPVPLYLQEEPLGGPLSPVAIDGAGAHLPLVASGWSDLQHSPAQLPLPPSFEEKVLSLRTHPRRAARSQGGRRDFGAAYVLTFRSGAGAEETYQRSQLLWLLDGVIVDREEIGARDALELRVYANAAGLPTDLTGFRLVDSPEYRQRRLEVLRQMVTTLEGPRLKKVDFFREDRDESSEMDDAADKQQLFQRRLKWLVGGGAGGGALLLLTGPLLGVMVAGGSLLGTRLLAAPGSAVGRRKEALESRLRLSLDSLREILERTIVLSSTRGWSKDQSGRPADPDEAV